ncbi:MAG TPA: patatin-like phospholipase family protein [Microvirga sp.]|jgi:predicted acylesterase/phospholipase RssA|nr:patatin-like phospholipase family protein [Microvirga sp.]
MALPHPACLPGLVPLPLAARVQRTCRGIVVAAVGIGLAACETLPRVPFTAEQQAEAAVPGFPDVRFWADSETAAREAARFSHQPRRDFTYLALSGGGGDGAFGAGLLNGWTQAGTRPAFTVVSGVSTGALMAPFAFLGSAYDDTLREMYTGGFGITLIDSPSLINAVFRAGVFDGNRLYSLVRQFVTEDVVARVAEEHRKGRRLLMLTTNLDAQRPVIWNMGAIAASGVPDAAELFRSVMTASASIPGVFSPTLIPAESGGHPFREMHVDGGVMANVFILPQDVLLRNPRLLAGRRANFYVIMNGKIEPSFDVVRNRTPDIAGRAVSTMTQVQSRATLQATHAFARRNGIGFHLAFIPATVPDGGSMGFDTEYMRRIYAHGYDRAVSGTAWSRSPSGGPDPATQVSTAARRAMQR